MKIVLLLDEEQVPCDESGDSELLLQLQQEGTSKLRLPKFPGGAEVLRHVRIPEGHGKILKPNRYPEDVSVGH